MTLLVWMLVAPLATAALGGVKAPRRVKESITVGVTHHVLGAGLSAVMIGLFLMVTRKKAITQILALLIVENAIFLVALGITSGMPLVVELGISFDVMLAVLVLGVLVRRIVDRFESMDVSRLSKLKG